MKIVESNSRKRLVITGSEWKAIGKQAAEFVTEIPGKGRELTPEEKEEVRTFFRDNPTADMEKAVKGFREKFDCSETSIGKVLFEMAMEDFRREKADLRDSFPFHAVQQKISDAYASFARDGSPTIPERLHEVISAAYPAWQSWLSKVPPVGLTRELADKAERLFSVLASSGELTDWKEGVVNLMARLSDVHSRLYAKA